MINVTAIYDKYADTSVSIATRDSNNELFDAGSGAFISSDGYIATNYHVISDNIGNISDNILIFPKNLNSIKDFNRPVSARVIIYDPAMDVAILKTKNKNEDPNYGYDIENQNFLKFIGSKCEKHQRVGSDLVMIGNPGFIDPFSLLCGKISNSRAPVNGVSFVTSNIEVFPGTSGSAVINKEGNIVYLNAITIVSSLVGKQINHLTGGPPAFFVKKLFKDALKGEKGIYKGKGYLGIKTISDLSNMLKLELFKVIPNLINLLDNFQGYLILEIDNNVNSGRGVINAKPTPLSIGDLMTSIKLRGSTFKLGNDSLEYYTPSHVTYVNPPGTEIEVDFIRLSTGKKYTSTIILDDFLTSAASTSTANANERSDNTNIHADKIKENLLSKIKLIKRK